MFQKGFFHLLWLLCWGTHAFVVEPWLDAKHGCNNPAYWCKSKETAKKCAVLEYCKVQWLKANAKEAIQTDDAKVTLEEFKRNGPVTSAKPVKVTLYYEPYSSDCQQFILYQWYPTYKALAGTGILELELVPFGNAKEFQGRGEWIFNCEHGPDECTSNIIETCGIYVGKNNMSIVAPFIHCMEYFLPTFNYLGYCANIAKVNASQIENCAKSALGNSLEHQMALKTKALLPPHQYVPWIAVDGVHTEEIQISVQTNMLAYVCSAYQGPAPVSCMHPLKHKKSTVLIKPSIS